jgi:O-methyltransferase
MGSGHDRFGKLMTFAFRVKSPRKSGVPGLPWAIPPHVQELINIVQPYTMVDPLRLAMLHQLAGEVPDEGDVVECGVCNGGSAAVLASVIGDHPRRSLWLYDNFQGMPPPGTRDGSDAQKYCGQLIGSMDRVNEVLALVEFPKDRAVIREGLFKDSFKQPLPQSVALLHIDADWYDGVLESLKTFYPLIPDGGIVILDDFGHWEGTREAFYDFCIDYNIRPLLERAGYTQAFWRKGEIHNRNKNEHFVWGMYRAGIKNS